MHLNQLKRLVCVHVHIPELTLRLHPLLVEKVHLFTLSFPGKGGMGVLMSPAEMEPADLEDFPVERTSQQLSHHLLTGTLAPDLKSAQTLSRG